MAFRQEMTPDREFRGSIHSENNEAKLRSMEDRKKRLLDEFKAYDTNHPNMIEREEVKTILDQRLKSMK